MTTSILRTADGGWAQIADVAARIATPAATTGQLLAHRTLADFIAGLVVTNDVSDRDVQLTKTQFYEAQSYPPFIPVGPALVLLDTDDDGAINLGLQRTAVRYTWQRCRSNSSIPGALRRDD